MEGQAKNTPDFRKKRQQFSYSLRREHRNQLFHKNRQQKFTIQDQQHHQKNYIVDSRYQQYIRKFIDTRFHIQTLSQLKDSAFSDDPIKKHYGVIGVRKIMSVTDNPPIQKVIDIGLIPKLIQYIQQQQFPQLQLEAAWALTNVASGTHQQCQSIVDKGVIPLFIKLLKSVHIGTVEQTVWALGNIATDSVASRDSIIKQGGIENIIGVIKTTKNNYIYNHSLWALSNLCRGHPLPKYKYIKQAIIVQADILTKELVTDEQTINDMIWAICYNLNLQQQRIDDLFYLGFENIVIKLLSNDETSTIIAAIRILARITSGNQEQLERVMQHKQLLDSLSDLISHSKKVIRAQTCWVLANIANGKSEHIAELISREDIIKPILNLFQTDNSDVVDEICYFFSNMAKFGQSKLVFNFFKEINIVHYYLGVLKGDDTKLVKTGLMEFVQILKLGDKFKIQGKNNPFIDDIFQQKGELVLEQLQLHDEKQIYDASVSLIEQFFQKQDQL